MWSTPREPWLLTLWDVMAISSGWQLCVFLFLILVHSDWELWAQQWGCPSWLLPKPRLKCLHETFIKCKWCPIAILQQTHSILQQIHSILAHVGKFQHMIPKFPTDFSHGWNVFNWHSNFFNRQLNLSHMQKQDSTDMWQSCSHTHSFLIHSHETELTKSVMNHLEFTWNALTVCRGLKHSWIT